LKNYQNNMKIIKKYLKQIFKLPLFRIIIVQLLRNKLINRRFKNLIELNGMNYIYKSKIKVFNAKEDSVTRDLCIFGIPQKEKKIFDRFIFEVSNAKSFLDIGAGIGLYTLFAHEHNKNIQTLSIEPNPDVFKALNKNLRNMSLNSKVAKVLNKVVSSKNDMINFFIPTGDDFSYGTSKKNLLIEKNISYRSISIDTTNLSEYKTSNFEIIKIDVEGSELDVLKTIGSYLKNCRLLFIEIRTENKTEVYELLKSFNFKPIIESKEEVGNYVFINIDS
tara:strand:- start:393 stop:1223 length:831 start_codon:yes stop_codon:yes gene_type:complete